MSLSRLYCIGLAGLIFILDQLFMVAAEICTDGSYCRYPKRCCSTGCCSVRSNNNYIHSHHLKYTVWNVWYFWFILIFILMSCFGGCGYYRRKKMVSVNQRRSRHSSRIREPTSRISSRVVSEPVSHDRAFYAYTGPEVEPQFFPPPYSEVVSKPDLYPVNKVDLPQYPVQPYNSVVTPDPMAGVPSNLPQPPPYSELPPSTAGFPHEATDQNSQGGVTSVPEARTSVPVQQVATAANNEGVDGN